MTTLLNNREKINKSKIRVGRGIGSGKGKTSGRGIKGQKSSFESVATIDALDDGGFTQDQNFTFKAHEQKPLNFRLIYNKRLGYSYRIRPMVKITS